MTRLPQFGGSVRPSRNPASGNTNALKGATMNRKKGTVIAAAIAIAALLTGCSTDSRPVVHATPIPTVTVTNTVVKTVKVTSGPLTISPNFFAHQAVGHLGGFTISPNTNEATLLLGTQVTMTNHVAVRGANAYSKQTLTSPQMVSTFLHKNAVAGARVANAIKQAGYGQAGVNFALSGGCYFAMQETVPSQIYGTSYQTGKNSSMVEAGARAVPPGDIQWLCAMPDGKIIWNATVRADCGNPNLTKIVPVTPSTPPAPPVSCMNTSVAGCQPPAVCTTNCTPVVCTTNCTPVQHKCPCVTPAQASQPVVDYGSPVPQYMHPPQVAGATVATQRPAPHQSASPGVVPAPQSTSAGNGYSNGGTGSAPGGAQCSDPNNCQSTSNPQPSGPAASPYPTPSSPNTGDPGMP